MEKIDDCDYRLLLKVLLNNLNVLNNKCSLERKKIHDIEWESNDDLPSILGEIEVRCDTVIGITTQCLRDMPNNINECVDILIKNSIFKSKTIVSWIALEGESYENILCYVNSVENLRVAILHLLESNKRRVN